MGVVVRHPGQRQLKSHKVRTAFFGVDIIDEAVNRFLIAFVVLQSDFDDRIVLGAVKINDIRG